MDWGFESLRVHKNIWVNNMETIGYMGSILTINAIPELFRTITDKRCHIGWPMLLLWFIGEIFMTTYAIMLWNIPLMMNYIFNFIVVVVMLAYKMKHFYRKKMHLTTEHYIKVEY
jgi:uncharacterized protein with PQ loop repeat